MKNKRCTNDTGRTSFINAMRKDLKVLQTRYLSNPSIVHLYQIAEEHKLSSVSELYNQQSSKCLYETMFGFLISCIVKETVSEDCVLPIFLLHFFYTKQTNEFVYIDISIEHLELLNQKQNVNFMHFLNKLKDAGAFNVLFSVKDHVTTSIMLELKAIKKQYKALIRRKHG